MKKKVKSNTMNSGNNFKGMSLFSGMGGDTLGLQKAGVEVVAFNDFDKHAIQTHKQNFTNSTLLGNEKDKYDICKIDEKDLESYKNNIDLIFAGFPCQGFSQGGKKLPNDPRNTLFREFVRFSKIIKPKYIIGENVDGLLNRKTDKDEYFIDVICKEFDNIGYNLKYQVCHIVQHGAPQLRKRLIIVGIRKDLSKVFTFPEPLNDRKNDLPGLLDIIEFSMEGTMKIKKEDYDFSSLPEECIVKDLNNEEDEDSNNIHPYLKMKVNSKDVEHNGKKLKNLISFGKRESPLHIEIIDIRKPSKTIICTYDHQPRLFVPIQNKKGYYLRCLLPDELKQIQGFPKDFKLCGNKKQKIKQIGNAVPPPLIERIVKKILY